MVKFFDRKAEELLVSAKAKKRSLLADKITGDNIYKALIFFDKLYAQMNEVEKQAVCLIFATIFHTFATGMKEYLKLTEYGPGRYNDCRK